MIFLSRLRCLPAFLIIGVAKSGTTDLCFRLTKIKDVHLSMNKEVFFWDFYSYEINATLHDYVDCFDRPTTEMLNTNAPSATKLSEDNSTSTVMLSAARNGLVGECTSTTLTSNPYWRLDPRNEGRNEPLGLTPRDLMKLNPEVKVIAILRDPVSRLYSHFNMWCGDERLCGPDVFHAKIINSILWWQKCVTQHSERACLYGDVPGEAPVDWALGKFWPETQNYSGTIRDSLYALHLAYWLEHIPREQILCIKAEDYVRDTLKLLKDEVLPFLEINGLDPEEENELMHKQAKGRPYKSPMFNETRHALESFFQPYNQKLASLLQDSKWTWDY